MRTAPVRVDRVPKRHAGSLRHLVDRGASADLVEAGAEGLGGVEGPDDRGLLEPRQSRAALVLDREVVPPHYERMFAHRPDGSPDPADRPRTIERHDAGGVDKA